MQKHIYIYIYICHQAFQHQSIDAQQLSNRMTIPVFTGNATSAPPPQKQNDNTCFHRKRYMQKHTHTYIYIYILMQRSVLQV